MAKLSDMTVNVRARVIVDIHHCDFTAHAQRVLKNKNWYPYKFERAFGGVILTGAVMPLTKTGRPNVRKRDKSTEIKVIYPIKEKHNG